MSAIAGWKGVPADELSREELLEVVCFCGQEIESLRQDRARWRDAADPVKYLMGLEGA